MATKSPKLEKQESLGSISTMALSFEGGERWVLSRSDGQIWATQTHPERKNFVFEVPVTSLSFLNAKVSGDDQGSGEVSAPSQGRVLRLLVKDGDAVKKGQVLVVLEAMKTEISVQANHDGHVKNCALQLGQVIKRGQKLFTLI